MDIIITPWGHPDKTRDLGLGITHIMTPSHGGMYISDPSVLPADVTATFCNGENWAEEDVEEVFVWALLWDKLDTSNIKNYTKKDMIEMARRNAKSVPQHASILKYL